MTRILPNLVIAFASVSSLLTAAELTRLPSDTTEFRRPVGIGILNADTAVAVNRRSGSISVIDFPSNSVVAEYRLTGRLTDVAVWNDRALITDAEHARLVSVRISKSAAYREWELPLPLEPVSISVSSEGNLGSVCCLWSRKLVLIELPQDGASAAPRIVAEMEIPFCPQEQLHLEGHDRLLVADAFGGRLAVVNLKTRETESIRELPMHNIRGLEISTAGDRVLVSHQILNELAPPRTSDIIWGVMLSNGIRELRLEDVLDASKKLAGTGRFIPLGDGSRGAGDPDSLVVMESGRVVVALAGIGEIAVVEPNGYSLRRVPIGRRPVAVAALDKQHILVADEMGEAIAIVDLAASGDVPIADAESPHSSEPYAAPTTYSVNRERARSADVAVRRMILGPVPPETAAESGERLFYDARRSHGNWFSCHSCHTDGHSNGGMADTLSDGGYGAPKRVLSLRGVAETGPWAWKGNQARLIDQVHQSVSSTMQGAKLTAEQASDLVAFLETLSPPPPFEPSRSPADADLIRRGREQFEALNCNACHSGDTFTTPAVYHVGLTDELGTREFNPPSLRGVGYRTGLFHSKQAADLGEVIGRFRHQVPEDLTDDERQALLRYLRSL